MSDAEKPTFIPMNRINGISNRRRMPIIGKIRLGVKVSGPNGFYPKETPHFVVPEEVAKVFGAQPNELEVMFVSNDPTVNCPQALRWYGEAAGLQCIGNNQVARRLNQDTWKTESRSCPCEKLESGECGPRANLIFMIPKVSSGGLFQIDSSSINSMETINSYFDFLALTLGRIAMIPLKLRRVPVTRRREGRPTTHYPLELRYEGSADETARYQQETETVLKKIKMLEIQEPIEINPVLDPGAHVVMEEELEDDPGPVAAEVPGDTPSETHDPTPPAMFTPSTAAAKAPEPTPLPAGPLISVAQTNYLLRLTKALPLTEDDLRMKVRALTQREASGLIKRLIAQDFSYFTSSPGTPPISPANTGAVAESMTDPQFKKIMGLVISMDIQETHVKSLTSGYTKRQASTLIDQLVGGDFSAFQEMKEEELPVLVTPESAPVEEKVEF
ncbi:MAG: hypothetical protein KF784_16755 [Fimbriimonadaceae bacterium]|nr:hypothetical protein [Fimbriimonadaceae bacterium]